MVSRMARLRLDVVLADELAGAVERERPRHVDSVARLGPRRIGRERRSGALRNDDLIRHGSNSRFTSSMHGRGNGASRGAAGLLPMERDHLGMSAR
jgi:hypothetical protein